MNSKDSLNYVEQALLESTSIRGIYKGLVLSSSDLVKLLPWISVDRDGTVKVHASKPTYNQGWKSEVTFPVANLNVHPDADHAKLMVWEVRKIGNDVEAEVSKKL